MLVLGIHDGHNSGAALVKDGQVVSAVSEERLNNIKNYSGPPLLSIEEVYKIANLNPEATDLIAIGCFVRVGAPYADINWLGRLQVEFAPYLHSHFFSKMYVKILHKFRQIKDLKSLFYNFGLADKKIIFIDHHLSHAATAYFQRPFTDPATVLTLDGSGDGLSATVSVGEGFKIKRIAETVFYDSLSNNLYSEVTAFLGMKRWEHEYKIMGLAPYGRDDGLIEEFRKIIRINPDRPLEFQNTFGAYLYKITDKLSKILAGRRFDNISYTTQKYFEELLVQWVKNAISVTGINNIVASGGAFLNVKANKKIRELKQLNNFFVYPAADDGGTPVGAALVGYFNLCRLKKIKPTVSKLENLYYGRQFTDNEIEGILKKSQWKKNAEFFKKGPEAHIAKLIANGKIIARFNGREEWGPRALGNRSILADPRNLSVVQKLNFAIKERDFWMPFAGSIIEKYAGDYLKDIKSARFMIEAFDSTAKAQGLIAALHPFDKTCRPQTVSSYNPGFEKIIENFYKLTGIPAVLNTSFNLHGFPIVGSPESAVSTFEKSGLDALALGNWLIEK